MRTVTRAFLLLALTVANLSAAERPRLLGFGSSDSCEWCKVLARRVFETDAWRNWETGHVAFTRVDLPRGDGVLAPDERARNNELADRLGVTGIPTFVLLSPDGETVLGRVKVPDSARGLGRDMKPEAFIAALEEVLAAGATSAPLSLWRTYRFVPVVALLLMAVMLLVDKSKLPLALRGLKKVLGHAAPTATSSTVPPVPVWKRLLAFVLVLAAFLLAVL